jgi:hypothetical protein
MVLLSHGEGECSGSPLHCGEGSGGEFEAHLAPCTDDEDGPHPAVADAPASLTTRGGERAEEIRGSSPRMTKPKLKRDFAGAPRKRGQAHE